MTTIKVLEKAFTILEIIADDPSSPHSLSMIARRLGFNESTTAHILKTLVQKGYLEKSYPQKGYTLGPMAYYMTRYGPYRKDLINKAQPYMVKLAEEVHEEVLMVTMHLNRRYILFRVNGNKVLKIKKEFEREESVYQAATSRLLLAFEPLEQQYAFIENYGLPGGNWPEMDSPAKLIKALKKIRDSELSIIMHPHHVVGVARPIWENGQVVAALGLWLPEYRFQDKNKQKILEEIQTTSNEISKTLSSQPLP